MRAARGDLWVAGNDGLEIAASRKSGSERLLRFAKYGDKNAP